MISARYASLLAFAQSRGSDCGRDPDGKFGGGNKCAVVGGVLRPQSTEPHDQEPTYNEADDDHVYHVTTQGNAAGIVSDGFKQSGSTVKGGSYENYSKGKTFFTEKSGLAFWRDRVEDHLFHEHDDPPPVAIVRVKKSEVEHLLKPDEIGTKDAGSKAYYVDLTGKKQSRAFCATGQGNGIDNSCGAKIMSAPDKDGGGGGRSPAPAAPDTWDENTWSDNTTGGGTFDELPDGLSSLGSLSFHPSTTTADVMGIAKQTGIEGPSQLLTIGACNVPDADVRLTLHSSNLLSLRADIPAGSKKSDGKIQVDTSVVSGTDGPEIDYGLLSLDDTAQKKADKDESYQLRVAGKVMDVMLSSLEAAEKAGFVRAETLADGYGPGNTNGKKTEMQGYRLWGKFGFDGDVPRGWFMNLQNKGIDVSEALNPLDSIRLREDGVVRLQQVLATKKGEAIWKQWGIPLPLTFDFTDKKSDGYLRYQRMLSLSKKAKSYRSLFFEYVAGLELREDPSLWSGFVEQRAFCPNGEGNGVTNDCSPAQTAKSFPEGSQKLRDAVDSVAPAPDQVWNRSKGLAETPPAKEMDDIANEQTSNTGVPLTPEAEASYGSLVDEIGRQYEALTAAGLKARAWRGEGEPYGDPPGSTKPNSDKMRQEVAKTGEFSFFMTDKGFGTGDATPDHPMLRETKYKTADGEPMIANDLFRVVHDMVAHVRGGYSFSTNGEYNGMLTHASTLPEAAWPALFAETFGQNAVYEKTKNYAPQNAYASKVGPEIIRGELKKRTKSSRAAKNDGDEPLGYQHIKSRPALLKSLVEKRAFCPNGTGGGISNTCGASEGGNTAPPIGSPQFKEWFGGSKVVDSSGSPLVVYHGTSSEFDEFDPAASPVNDDGYMGAGSYFIADKTLATQYSLMASDNKPGTPRVVEAYLSIKNPVVISQSDQTYGMTREEVVAWTEKKKSQGHDGATNGQGEWVAFYPKQIKQAPQTKKQSRSSDCGRDDDGKFGDGNTCRVGINVNDESQDFTGQILSGAKTTETRITNSLKPYIGQNVGIVRTGKGKATLVGTMKVGEPKFYSTPEEFDADFDKHQIDKDSPHYIGPQGKFGYPLSEVKPLKPVELPPGGRIARVLHKSKRELTVEFDLGGESPEHPRESRGDAPAPKKDQVKGSDVNAEGSAKNKSGDISLSEGTISSLKKKVEEHNAAMREAGKPDWTHVRLSSLKAVFRRGAGAFSTSHRPGMARDQWAMARVNAFLTLARRGRPENAKYTTDNDLLNSKHPKHSKESRADDCGRDDDGRFSSNNKCGGQVDMPKEDPRGRMRYESGVQTDAARKLYQMGTSEKKLKGLVETLGGDVSTTRADINPPSVDVTVADKDGNKLFHIEVQNGRARLYPTKDLSDDELGVIKNAASEAFAGRDADTKIKVFTKASDIKSWEKENAAKIKAWEDKYRFSVLLPPHERPKKWERSLDTRHASLLAFAQARGFCPNGEGNGVTNDCSSKGGGSLQLFSEDTAKWHSGESLDKEFPREYWTEKDTKESYSVVDTRGGKVPVLDRRDTNTPDYLDEIECHGSECGLGVTFEDAKMLQPDSDIDPSWSPLDAYIGKGYGYFTGNDSEGDESIDFHGADYGTIDDYMAEELKKEKQKENEAAWESLDKNSEFGDRWDSMTEDEKNAAQSDWVWQQNEFIDEEIDTMRNEARGAAVEKMKEELEKAVARETIECCLQLYRGISVDEQQARRILSDGYVSHDAVNSWTTSRGTARSFGGNRLLLVMQKPRVGYVFKPDTHSEAEVVRPPSRLKITGAVKTKTGMVLYVNEDEDYR